MVFFISCLTSSQNKIIGGKALNVNLISIHVTCLFQVPLMTPILPFTTLLTVSVIDDFV